MYLKVFFISMVITSFSYAEKEHEGIESPLIVNSGEAEYDGQAISLIGNVVVQHGLGTIAAQRLTISGPESENKRKFTDLKMDGNVSIDLQEGGRLTCERAEVDYEKLVGSFYGDQAHDVSYSTGQTEVPLTIKGIEMQVNFLRMLDGNSSKTSLNQIRVMNGVQVQYNQEYFLQADHMCWNNHDLTLTLSGQVYLTNNAGFILKTEHELIITQRLIDGKKEIHTITSPKQTELVYSDSKKKYIHTIVCHGPLIIDQENLQIWMHSPKDTQGKVLEGKQIVFENLMGEMSAEQMQIIYRKTEKQWIPEKMNLMANVQIFNRFDGHIQESSSVLQYALADQVEYTPETEQMLLSGVNGNRVLFFDKINSLQMSAPALNIHFDKLNHKQSVQGVGDVRFTFIERELNQLKARFRMNEKL